MANALYQNFRQLALNPVPFTFVSAVANNGSGLVRITTSTVHHLQTSDVISIAEVTGTGGLPAATNGAWTVTVIDTTHFDLQGSTFAGAYTSGGVVSYPDNTMKHLGTVVRWGVGSTGASTYGDDICVALINTANGTFYIPDIHQHQYISDVTSNTGGSGSPGPIIARSTALQSKTVTTGSGGTLLGGVANAASITFTSPGSAGNVVQAFILYKNTGVDTSSTLIGYFDTATGLPVTLNGSDLVLSFDSGSNKIFVL